ncbi:MAG: glycosyltransferase family 4 protein [Chloroflexota bacterium]|nr:MAG: glycosyltransferase family 4 protein [Chloroflexota bacterium]
MHISILHYASPPIVGGVESTIYHHARLLRSSGYSVSVIAGRGESFDDEIPYYEIPEINSRHPSILKVGNELAGGILSDEFYQIRDELVDRLNGIIGDTDVIIAHNVPTLHKNLPLTAALETISKNSRLGMIAWCHDFAWQDSLYTPDLHAGYPWDLLKSPWPNLRYVTVSQHRRTRLAKLLQVPEANIEVIPPGVDVYKFLDITPTVQEIVDQLQLLDADPLILLPARITRRKNIEFAIKVIESLKNEHPQVALVITGPPGPHNPKNIAYLDMLLGLRQDLKLISNVHFLYELKGEQDILILPEERISELFRLADVIIFPSHREGFGIPVLEAGLSRVPVFASDIPPVRESSNDLINLFDPSSDPSIAANQISTYIQTDRSYQLRRHVIKNYTWQSVLKKQIIPLLQEFDPLIK